MAASHQGHKEVVARLLRQGVDMNTLSEDQDTALSLAFKGGFQEVADLLIQAGANRDPRDVEDLLEFINSTGSASAKKKKKKSRGSEPVPATSESRSEDLNSATKEDARPGSSTLKPELQETKMETSKKVNALSREKSSQTDRSDDPSALKQQIALLSEELQESKRKLLKVQDVKKKENQEFIEKINILTNEKVVLEQEVTGLKKTIQQKVSMKENRELAAKRVAKLERDLRETTARLESERKVNELLLQDISRKEAELRTQRNNNNLLLEKVSRKETEIKTLRSYNDLAANKIAELEAQVRENQARFDIILTAARSPKPPSESQLGRSGAAGPQSGLLSSVSGQAGGAEGGVRPSLAQPPPVISTSRYSPVPLPTARPAEAVGQGKAGTDPQKKENANDVLIAMAVAMLPDLTAEEADGFIKIILKRSPGKLSTKKILAGVKELWKSSLGAVGGEAGTEGTDSFRHDSQIGGQGQGLEEEEEDEVECSICLEPLMPDSTKELSPCQHRFHLHCIQVH